MNRYVQAADALHKGGKGQVPGVQEMLLNDACQAQLLDPAMVSDAVQFMSLQVLALTPAWSHCSGPWAGRKGYGV